MDADFSKEEYFGAGRNVGDVAGEAELPASDAAVDIALPIAA